MGVRTETIVAAEFGCDYCERCKTLAMFAVMKTTIRGTMFFVPITPSVSTTYRLACLGCQAFGKKIPSSEVEQALSLAASLPTHRDIQAGLTAIEKYALKLATEDPDADPIERTQRAILLGLEPFERNVAMYIAEQFWRSVARRADHLKQQ